MENNQTPTKVEDLYKRHPREEFKGFAPNGAMIFGRIDYTPKDDYYESKEKKDGRQTDTQCLR